MQNISSKILLLVFLHILYCYSLSDKQVENCKQDIQLCEIDSACQKNQIYTCNFDNNVFLNNISCKYIKNQNDEHETKAFRVIQQQGGSFYTPEEIKHFFDEFDPQGETLESINTFIKDYKHLYDDFQGDINSDSKKTLLQDYINKNLQNYFDIAKFTEVYSNSYHIAQIECQIYCLKLLSDQKAQQQQTLFIQQCLRNRPIGNSIDGSTNKLGEPIKNNFTNKGFIFHKIIIFYIIILLLVVI